MTVSDDEALDRIDEHSDEVRRQIARAQARLYDRERQRREDRRAYAREYYAKNREQQLEYQRQQRKTQREKDPERYRELRRARAKRWRDRHKETENARKRAQYRRDPQPALERRARYYAEHAEEIKAKRRERYAANKQKALAQQQALRDREKRRRDAGLPVRRLHPVDPAGIRAHAEAADEFFARPRSRADMQRIRDQDLPTPPEWVDAWQRDCRRARAAYHLAEQREELARLHKELDRARPGPKPKPRLTAAQIEEARLDAIGRQVNDRLRREPRRRPHDGDPAAPHPILTPTTTMGMNR
ncbi:hypothetical protein [Microbacterium sp.]|uniref:hypothetical protein n=1 Tax=Microbacterium sp. TaxID=51671 RepID=UPI0037C71F87